MINYMEFSFFYLIGKHSSFFVTIYNMKTAV